jgi:hypothetical protein
MDSIWKIRANGMRDMKELEELDGVCYTMDDPISNTHA